MFAKYHTRFAKDPDVRPAALAVVHASAGRAAGL